MKDINELIGIIASIDYDEVINDREINYLKKWIDANRNITIGNNQDNIIKLLDSILSDNLITKEEKHILLSYCMEIKATEKSTNPVLYELTGIIEGIISDGLVNEKEVNNLKKWVSNNGFIRDVDSYSSLCKAIDLILEDDSITKEEQDEMLNMLRTMINDSNFSSKLSRLYSLVKNKENIGLELIDILDDSETANKIHDMAIEQLYKALNSYSCSNVSDPIIVFISLTLIGMLSYDGDYYSSVQDVYSELYDSFSEQRIENLIRNILRKFITEDGNSNDSRLINIALRNAIVPSPFLAHFFDFIFDIYKTNFEYELSDDLHKEFEFIYDGLKNFMLDEDDEISITVTKKTYKLIKTTKQLVADETQLESIIALSVMVVKIIDEHIWEQEANIQNEYFRDGYKKWCSTLEKKELERRNGVRATTYARWEPDFKLNGREIVLVPPIHKIKDEYDWSKVRVEVVVNGEIRRNIENPNIREIIGGYKITVEPMIIYKPLGKVVYRLMEGDNVIYDSGEKLFREIILFNSDGNEIKNNTDYSGVVTVCHNANVDSYYAGEDYKLRAMSVSVGDTFVFGDNVVNFSKSVSSGVVGDTYESCFVVDAEKNKYLRVLKDFNYLIFECEDTVDKFIINIDGKNCKLSSFEYEKVQRSNFNRYMLKLGEYESGIHTFEISKILDGKTLKLFSDVVVLDKSLIFETNKIDSETCNVQISSELFGLSISKNVFVLDNLERIFNFSYLGKEYYYSLPICLDIYKITNDDWKKNTDPIWIGNVINESILTLFGNYSHIKVKTLDGRVIIKDLSFTQKNNYSEISIGFLKSYKNDFDALLICIENENGNESQIMCVLNCFIKDTDLDIRFDQIAKQLSIITSYYGEGNVFFEIEGSNNEVVYKSELLHDGENTLVNGLKSFENYQINFYEKMTGLFAEQRLMKSFSKVFYAWSDFENKTFKISEAICDDYSSGFGNKIRQRFNKSYITFNYIHSNGKFSGEAFVRTQTSEFKLDKINPITIEICGEATNKRVELAIVSKTGDALMLDEKNHGILNDNDDMRALPIFSYYIDTLEV